MSAVDTSFYEKRRKRNFYLSVVFFVTIVAISAALWWYNRSLEKEISAVEAELAQIETSIAEKRANEEISLYQTYQENQVFFETMSERSQIPTFVTHIKKQLARFALEGEGFDYSDGSVGLSISAQTNESGFAYQKIVRFLREYRQDDKALFMPEHVESFSGNDRITFDITMPLKESF